MQESIQSLEKQAAERNLMKFSSKQMRSPTFRMGKPLDQHRLGAVTRMQLHESLVNKLIISQQHMLQQTRPMASWAALARAQTGG